MAKSKLIDVEVVHGNLTLSVALGDQSKPTLQHVPKGTKLKMDAEHAASMLMKGKLKTVSDSDTPKKALAKKTQSESENGDSANPK